MRWHDSGWHSRRPRAKVSRCGDSSCSSVQAWLSTQHNVAALFQVDEFSEWWDSNSGDRQVLFSPVQAEIAAGQASREASGKKLVEAAIVDRGGAKSSGAMAGKGHKRRLRRAK